MHVICNLNGTKCFFNEIMKKHNFFFFVLSDLQVTLTFWACCALYWINLYSACSEREMARSNIREVTPGGLMKYQQGRKNLWFKSPSRRPLLCPASPSVCPAVIRSYCRSHPLDELLSWDVPGLLIWRKFRKKTHTQKSAFCLKCVFGLRVTPRVCVSGKKYFYKVWSRCDQLLQFSLFE